MTVYRFIALMLFFTMVSNAGSASEYDKLETVQTVDWFIAHDPERNKVLIRCRNNPGELGFSPNCINAQSADSQKTWSAKGGAIKVAPLTFQKK